MRRTVGVLLVVALGFLNACGDDDKPDRKIAFLRTTEIDPASQEAFLDELDARGWSPDDNLEILNPDPSAHFDDEVEIARAVDDWLDQGVDLLVALSTTSAMVAARATGEIPVLTLASDPVASGLLRNARAPEGNVTGMAFRVPGDRTVDLARRLAPDAGVVGVLWPEEDPGGRPVRDSLVAAARSLDVKLVDQAFAGPDDVASAVDRLVTAGVEVVIIANSPSTVRAFDAIEEATMTAGLPVVSNTNTCTFALVVFAPDNTGAYRQLGAQAARVLAGTPVAEVPLEDPAEFRIVVRSRVADRLEIELPADLTDQAEIVSD